MQVRTIADGTMDQHRSDGGIHTARETAHDLAGTHLLPDPLGRLFDERGDGPVPRASAHAVGEIPQDLGAVIGVSDLGMEQQRVELAVGSFHCRNGRRGAVAAIWNPGGTADTSSP
jgi:hypothetical protein